MPSPLPDPAFVDSAICVRCGYCLTGLSAPGRCPECGTPFLEKQLVLYGVPRFTAGTSPLRRLAWAALIVVTAIYTQVWGLVFFVSWTVSATIGAAIVAGLVGLLLTSRRERRGAERFVVSPLGIARLPLDNPGETVLLDSLIVPWGGATVIELKRISPVWYRLRIGTATAQGRVASAVFDAGIRCTDALAPDVRRTIEGYLQQARKTPPSRLPPS